MPLLATAFETVASPCSANGPLCKLVVVVVMAGAVGLEPTHSRVNSAVPYHLATPQYLDINPRFNLPTLHTPMFTK